MYIDDCNWMVACKQLMEVLKEDYTSRATSAGRSVFDFSGCVPPPAPSELPGPLFENKNRWLKTP